MVAEIMGTVEQGAVKLDHALPFADQTRVRVRVELCEAENPALAAWERVKERLRLRPVHGGGKHMTREELHERR